VKTYYPIIVAEYDLSFISLMIDTKSAKFNENLKSGVEILRKLQNL